MTTDLDYADKYPVLAAGQVLAWPDPHLTTPSLPVPADLPLPELTWVIARMLEVLHAHQGIGLAAPQVGISLRLFVMAHDGQDRVFINPEWQKVSGTERLQPSSLVTVEEACLSFPGLVEKVARWDKVAVCFQDLENRPYGIIALELFEGLEAQCVQHETEHLDGVTLYSRMGPVKQDILRRKARKAQKRALR